MGDIVLATRNITKAFGALKACDDISIELRRDEIHAVIGPNGAGKSTLIKLICGNTVPDSGDVFLEDQLVTQLDTQSRAKRGLGRTFQVSALAMGDTVLENVILGRLGAGGLAMRFLSPFANNRELIASAHDVLERVGLSAKANDITSTLSHGERRQLEVAIALSLTPKAFIMDEPMAGLGSEGSQHMTRFLSELRHEAPILLVEHDMDAVFALADRISVLVYGHVIATGSVDQIRANQKVREAYLGEEL